MRASYVDEWNLGDKDATSDATATAAGDATEPTKAPILVGFGRKIKVVNYDGLPQWCQDNGFIVHVLLCFPFSQCMWRNQPRT